MKVFFPPFLFIASILSIISIGFYPHLSFLLYFAFFALYGVLWLYTYDILKIKKQATIKAYYKQDSLLYRYFGHFFLTKVLSCLLAFTGSVSLFFMLMFPSGSEILIFCLLVPCSIYGLKLVYMICSANLSPDFAPTLAKKYTAILCAVLAVIAAFMLHALSPSVIESTDIQSHFDFLMRSYHIAQMPSTLWRELFGFMLLKKALLDMLYFNVADTYLHIALDMLFACGYFACFVSFSLLCIGNLRLSKKPQKAQTSATQTNLTQSRAFRQFFAMVFFLIFIYIAFNISIHLQPLAKTQALPQLLSKQLLDDNKQYIQISMQGVQSFIRTNDLPSLEQKLKANLNDFQAQLNAEVSKTIEQYLEQKERIIEKYSEWYFSVAGEYTRLFYAAIGKGEDIAQEQFIFLLKAYTPYDLQERLNSLYDKHFNMLKTRFEQSFGFFITQKEPNSAYISKAISFDDVGEQLDVLNPRFSDGIAALLGASVVGVMVLKASGKALAKTSTKIIGKSVAKKSLGGAIGASGSLLCGSFAPLCAIGFFVASDYAINSVDEALNEEEFKQKMREGFEVWEIQLKNRLISYNAQLSSQILENLNLSRSSHSKEQ